MLECGNPLAKGFVVAQANILARNSGNAKQFAEALDGCVVCFIASRIEWRALCD